MNNTNLNQIKSIINEIFTVLIPDVVPVADI